MTPSTAAKAALALGGALVFGYGIRVDSPTIRWVGIGLVAAALALRFVMRDRGGPPAEP